MINTKTKIEKSLLNCELEENKEVKRFEDMTTEEITNEAMKKRQRQMNRMI